jgi:hypothetical protein
LLLLLFIVGLVLAPPVILYFCWRLCLVFIVGVGIAHTNNKARTTYGCRLFFVFGYGTVGAKAKNKKATLRRQPAQTCKNNNLRG